MISYKKIENTIFLALHSSILIKNNNKIMSYVIGIDFGGVLSVHDGGSSEHTNTSINMEGATEGIRELSKTHQLNIVSFCGKIRAAVTKESLGNSGLGELFVGQYYVKNKNFKLNICNYLGCHFIIDDTIEILDHIKESNKEIVTIWFEGSELGSDHVVAKDWQEVLSIIEKYDFTKHTVVSKHSMDISKFIYAV
jgi:hypothetical protein